MSGLAKQMQDPRKVLFFNPSIPAIRFSQMIAPYHQNEMVAMAEQLAKATGYLLVPRTCLHWQRKLQYADRQLRIGKKMYYLIKPSEMTESAWIKYQKCLEDAQEIDGS